MTNYKAFRECISDNDNELIIYASDNFQQFPRRDSSVISKCDRTLPVAHSNDLVVLRGTLDHEYHNWLRSLGLGSDLVVEFGEDSMGMTLSELIIIEPFLNVSSLPNDQWIISRDCSIAHLGIRDQICKKGMVHIGTIKELQISAADSKYIKETSLKIVNKMAETGYKGVIGIDYIVSDKGLFPVENNARFNGSSYVSLIVDNIEELTAPIPYWKFMKIKTSPCSFIELKEHLKTVIYNGGKANSIFPYNCEALSDTGNFSVIFLAENMDNVSKLEQTIKEMEVKKDVSIPE